jgi:hypothetical protein
VDLSDEDPDIVKIYLQWIYTKAFPIKKDMDSLENELRHELATLADCYVLGESLIDKHFKKATLNAYCSLLDDHATSRSTKDAVSDVIPVCTIYEGTPTGSTFRKHLVVAYWLRATGAYWGGSVDKINGLPNEFVADFTEAQLHMKE